MKSTFKLLAILLLSPVPMLSAEVFSKPNIVFILADGMGYGDVRCLHPERFKIDTPHMNKLAAEGMIFTDTHMSSSVCTTTRYGIMTGRYSWRRSCSHSCFTAMAGR